MDPLSTTYLVIDLAGTFAFALNGAWAAMRVARLDIVGVLVRGMLTAQGGGFLRDVMLGDLPPATFSDWRYLAVAATGSLGRGGHGSPVAQMLALSILLRPDS